MNDDLIRKRFHHQVLVPCHASPNTRVIDELGLQHGRCRADIAVVNGRMIGYEIKGETDSLKRLREQIRAYNAVFDQATVITTIKHRRKDNNHSVARRERRPYELTGTAESARAKPRGVHWAAGGRLRKIS